MEEWARSFVRLSVTTDIAIRGHLGLLGHGAGGEAEDRAELLEHGTGGQAEDRAGSCGNRVG